MFHAFGLSHKILPLQCSKLCDWLLSQSGHTCGPNFSIILNFVHKKELKESHGWAKKITLSLDQQQKKVKSGYFLLSEWRCCCSKKVAFKLNSLKLQRFLVLWSVIRIIFLPLLLLWLKVTKSQLSLCFHCSTLTMTDMNAVISELHFAKPFLCKIKNKLKINVWILFMHCF